MCVFTSSLEPDSRVRWFMRHMINQCFIFFQGLVQLKKMASTRMGTPKRVFFYIKIYPTWERLGRHRVQDLKFLQRFGTRRFNCISSGPGNTQRNNKHIIITWKRRFDVIITYLLRCMFAGALLHSSWFFTAGQVHGNRKGLILVKLSSLAPLNFVKISISV